MESLARWSARECKKWRRKIAPSQGSACAERAVGGSRSHRDKTQRTNVEDLQRLVRGTTIAMSTQKEALKVRDTRWVRWPSGRSFRGWDYPSQRTRRRVKEPRMSSETPLSTDHANRKSLASAMGSLEWKKNALIESVKNSGREWQHRAQHLASCANTLTVPGQRQALGYRQSQPL